MYQEDSISPQQSTDACLRCIQAVPSDFEMGEGQCLFTIYISEEYLLRKEDHFLPPGLSLTTQQTVTQNHFPPIYRFHIFSLQCKDYNRPTAQNNFYSKSVSSFF